MLYQRMAAKKVQKQKTRRHVDIYIYMINLLCIYIYIESASDFQPQIKRVKSSHETKSIMIFFAEINL